MPTVAELQTRLDAYRTAELRVLEGQEYTVSDGVIQRRLRRADLAEIRAAITQLEAQVASAQATAGGRRRIYYGVPRP